MAAAVSGVAAAGLGVPLSAAVHAGHGGAGLCALRGELLHPAAARRAVPAMGSDTGVGGCRCGIRCGPQDPAQHGGDHHRGAGADGGQLFLYRGRHKQRWLPRLAGSAATIAALCLLVFGVYLQPAVTQVLGITPDAWMQDRYNRNYGVITGFMTNLTNLEISKPEEYSQEAVDALLDNADESQKFATSPLYATSYSAVTPRTSR